MSGEFAAIDRLQQLLARPIAGETWIGDDAAVVHRPNAPWLLLAADAVVDGVHADLTLTGLDDLGWKVMTANVSDIAAMGGRPGYALVTVAGPAQTDLELLYAGIGAAADAYGCPVVGGDLSQSPTLVVTVAITGTVEGAPVLRSGARPGDGIWVTGPLGAAAAGLRAYRDGAGRGGTGRAGATEDDDPVAGPTVERALRRAHARPVAQVAAGEVARRAGATAMIDVSDGLAADLGHVADASGVGVHLDRVPVAPGALETDALGGGEDYALVFCAPELAPVTAGFDRAGLPAPIRIGQCTADPSERRLRGGPLGHHGWQHEWTTPTAAPD